MTPSERAAYLIKELGYEKAMSHAEWTALGCIKTITREYWTEVGKEIQKAQYAAYDKTINSRCQTCDTPIPEGSGYCEDCKPK